MKPELQQVPIESPIGGVLIVGGTAYFGTQGGTFHALDLSTGQENWRYETTAPVLLWPILSGGGSFISVARTDSFMASDIC